jgi:predicted O-linked N-acetylglucosamine transferase (SPINDLY family)
LADLALDTLPYNAHSTGIDMLWAGVPFVTCRGETFAGRVGASLLRAVRLDALVTDTLDGYFELALALARDPQRLQAARQQLACDRAKLPLFDMLAFARALEDMFERMHDQALQGTRTALPAEAC